MNRPRRLAIWLLMGLLLVGALGGGASAAAQGLPTAEEINQALRRRLTADKQTKIRNGESADGAGGVQHGDAAQIGLERGDEVVVAGRRYRLWGVVAPAPNEYGGYTSAQQLKHLLDGKQASCVATGGTVGGGQFGFLPLARCRVDGKDVAALLAAAGYARDCPRQSRGFYAAQERSAIAMVGGGFDLPPECVDD